MIRNNKYTVEWSKDWYILASNSNFFSSECFYLNDGIDILILLFIYSTLITQILTQIEIKKLTK